MKFAHIVNYIIYFGVGFTCFRGSETQAVRADKDVFLELADMVGDESLE